VKGVERTPQVIAAEIIAIKNQTRKILLASAIEVGRRLAEAKALLPHGNGSNGWNNQWDIPVERRKI